MADDRVLEDDESKIVTNFLLNTCRLLRCEHHTAAALMAGLMFRPDAKEELIPLITGSSADFYIQPMLSCVGDIDIMVSPSDQLAIPVGYPPPTQLPAEFHNSVVVWEIIDSEYPSYMYLVLSYLLTKNTDADRYDAVRSRRRYFMPHRFNRSQQIEMHGPALTDDSGPGSFDGVYCVRCMSWPTQAAAWPTRHRNYGWPDSATVDRVVSNGCDVVQVAHRQCRQREWMREYQRRLSFSRAEIVLLNMDASTTDCLSYVTNIYEDRAIDRHYRQHWNTDS